MKQITIAEAIQRTVEHREVFHDEMLHIMRQIMRGELTPAQIAGFIIGLRVKKETIGEIAAAAQVMRELATPVEVKDERHLVDDWHHRAATPVNLQLIRTQRLDLHHHDIPAPRRSGSTLARYSAIVMMGRLITRAPGGPDAATADGASVVPAGHSSPSLMVTQPARPPPLPWASMAALPPIATATRTAVMVCLFMA